MFSREPKQSARIDTLIGKAAKVDGDVEFEGGLHLDGRVAGNVRAVGAPGASLSVSEHGSIEGSVEVANVTLNGSVGGSSTSLTRVLQDPVAALGAGLTLPFLNVERMRLGTESAGEAYLQAASEFRGTLHSALQEVDNALSARERLRTQAEARRTSYEAARDVARLYEVRYREGDSALRTWLDAQQTLRGAELALAQLLRQQAANDVTLMLALGGS